MWQLTVCSADNLETCLFFQVPVAEAFPLPSRKVHWWMDDFALGFRLESCGACGTTRDTQTASDTSFTIHNRHPFLHRDSLHLTPIRADSASHALFGVDDRVVVGAGYRVLYAPFVDASEYAAAATAAVADVEDSLDYVAYGVD